jgi:hypothetical protein
MYTPRKPVKANTAAFTTPASTICLTGRKSGAVTRVAWSACVNMALDIQILMIRITSAINTLACMGAMDAAHQNKYMITDYLPFPWWTLLDKLGPMTPKYRSTIKSPFKPKIKKEFNRRYLNYGKTR